ncbi:MAG TPA: PEP-CTERM sorting domain-containing protein, partial [Verrucomicrobiae bacterium]
VDQTTIPTTIGDQYQLSLCIGTSPIYDSAPVSILVTAGSASTTFTSTPLNVNQWETFTFDFIATSSSTSLSLAGQASTNVKYIGLDNVSVVPIPEPGTFALFAGSGLLALVGWRRFRKA